MGRDSVSVYHLHPKYLLLSAILALTVWPVRASANARQRPQKPIIHGPTDEKVVALTFDDGPDPLYTPRILSILKNAGVHATFFEVGQLVEKHPELTRLVIREGHALGNHTYSHPDLRLDTAGQVRQEIAGCDQAIANACGVHTRLFRPPKRLYDDQILEALRRGGYQTVLWSLTVEHKSTPTPMEMADRVVAKARPGTIILAHDGRLDREHTVAALPTTIEGLKNKGYRFVTVPEMIELIEKSKTHPANSAQAPKHRIRQPQRGGWQAPRPDGGLL